MAYPCPTVSGAGLILANCSDLNAFDVQVLNFMCNYDLNLEIDLANNMFIVLLTQIIIYLKMSRDRFDIAPKVWFTTSKYHVSKLGCFHLSSTEIARGHDFH